MPMMIPLMSSSESEYESENEKLSLPSTDEMDSYSADLMKSDSALELVIFTKVSPNESDMMHSDSYESFESIPDESVGLKTSEF